jgi:hypothetical protein
MIENRIRTQAEGAQDVWSIALYGAVYLTVQQSAAQGRSEGVQPLEFPPQR